MGIERFTWLNDAIKAHQNITFPSSSIIEGEFGLLKNNLLDILLKNYYVLMNLGHVGYAILAITLKLDHILITVSLTKIRVPVHCMDILKPRKIL
jgi:hypothetical protein